MKIKIMCFWFVAFSHIIFRTIKGNNWNMVYVNLDNGVDSTGRQKRKQLIAKRSGSGAFECYWQGS